MPKKSNRANQTHATPEIRLTKPVSELDTKLETIVERNIRKDKGAAA